eukprot:90019_1
MLALFKLSIICNFLSTNSDANTSSLRRKLADIAFTDWTVGTAAMPRRCGHAATGYYNESIFLLGGAGYGHQLMEYDIHSDEFIDHGSQYLSHDTEALGFTQVKNIIYMIAHPGNRFSVFDLTSKIYTYGWENITIPVSVPAGCLAFSDNYLFVSGGYKNGLFDSLNTFQIFHITSMTWLSNTPQMNDARCLHACVTHPVNKRLYVIGGEGGICASTFDVVWLDTIESINIGNIDNITNERWVYIDRLMYAADRAQAIIFGQNIVVLGGYYRDSNNSNHYVDEVQVINIEDGTVSSNGLMANAEFGSAAIIVDKTIYAFSGYCPCSGLSCYCEYNTWQYTNLLTMGPTSSPTAYPTNPTLNPTLHPAEYPTTNPTIDPTPTKNPTYIPTNVPTYIPTTNPTIDPTEIPTQIPTFTITEGIKQSTEPPNTSPWWYIITALIILIIICTIIICVSCGLWRHSTRKSSQLSQRMDAAETELRAIKSHHRVQTAESVSKMALQLEHTCNNNLIQFINAQLSLPEPIIHEEKKMGIAHRHRIIGQVMDTNAGFAIDDEKHQQLDFDHDEIIGEGV